MYITIDITKILFKLKINMLPFYKNYVSLFIFSWLTSRVLSWSSLDWDRSRWSQLDLVLGTSFDIFTHALNSYCLFQVLDVSMSVIVIYLLIVAFLTVGILWNPKLAWANANDLENAPSWVKNRVKPLTRQQSQKWDVVESAGMAIFGQ